MCFCRGRLRAAARRYVLYAVFRPRLVLHRFQRIDFVVSPAPARPPTTPSPFTASLSQPDPAAARSVDASPHLAAVQQLRQHGGRHAFVLVHGYQGNSYDMHLFRNVLAVHYSDAAFLCSVSNEGMTDTSIDDMAARLAREVADFVAELGGAQRVARLSFVAHSLGGLIVRASLAFAPMRALVPKLHTLVTLASPHCGYLFSESRLLRSGLAMMQRWTNSTCLQQVRFGPAFNFFHSLFR